MSTQVHYLSHRTVQYGAHSFADSGGSGSASRVACSFGSGKLYICLSNKCFKVYPAYSLCDRCKTLTGSPDPMYMHPTNKPCRGVGRVCPERDLCHVTYPMMHVILPKNPNTPLTLPLSGVRQTTVKQEYISAGCVPSAALAVSPATHAPATTHAPPPHCHAHPHMPPCHTCPSPPDRILDTRL